MFHYFHTSLNSLLLLLSQVLANIGASYNSFISIIFLTWLNHLSPKTTHHFIWCICTWIHYGRQVLQVWYQKWGQRENDKNTMNDPPTFWPTTSFPMFCWWRHHSDFAQTFLSSDFSMHWQREDKIWEQNSLDRLLKHKTNST